jgi:hypothetical protein
VETVEATVRAQRDFLTPLFESEQGPEVEAVTEALDRLEVALEQLRTVLGD